MFLFKCWSGKKRMCFFLENVYFIIFFVFEDVIVVLLCLFIKDLIVVVEFIYVSGIIVFLKRFCKIGYVFFVCWIVVILVIE